MGKNQHYKPEPVMPEYQMFPRGMWHMLGAVMLMIPALVSAVGIFSDLVEYFSGAPSAAELDIAVIAVLTFVLGTATVMISRGYTGAKQFLTGFSLILVVGLAVASAIYLFIASYFPAGLAAVGLACALTALVLYRSNGLDEYVSYARDVWAAHRARR